MWRSPQPGRAYDVTANAIGQNTTNHLPVSGTPLAGLANPGGAANSLYFLDANNHIHEIYDHNDNVWYDNDFMTMFGLVAAAPGTALATYPGSGSIDMHLHYVGSDQHIHDVYHNSTTGWASVDVTANSISGNTTNHQPASGTAMAGLLDPGGAAVSFYFLDTVQHIHESYCDNDEVWHDNDFMTLFGLPAAAPGTPLAVYAGSGTIDMHLHYLGADGHIHDLYHNTTTGWAGYDVTANATLYQGNSDQPAAATALRGFLWPGGGAESIYYLDPNQHIHETYAHNDEKWTDVDDVAISGIGLAASGSALAGYTTPGSVDAHLHYLKTNQHVYDMRHNSSTGWSEQDLNGSAQVAVPDSGTVSLTVGSFTATACFGPSSNPVCNGQPVNDSPAQVASALAQALNVPGSPVSATASSASINLTWKAIGTFTTPVGVLSTTHDNPSLFPNPSFTSTATNFSGGSGANLAILNLSYDFHVGAGNNGNVFAITNNKDTTRSQTFTYDPLDRLISAQNAGNDCTQKVLYGNLKYWGNTYTYDAWGNLTNKTKMPSACAGENLNAPATTNNQLVGYTYDAAGNMTGDPTDQVTATYDPENRIATATKNGASTTYVYDAAGNRVEKTTGGSTPSGTLYWYMSPGIVAESDLSGSLQSEYIFFDGERVARKDFPGNAVSYYFSDHLKTTDIVTDAQGSIKNESDFYPWGGELQFANADSNHYKFTGKERDSETGLDYFGARYYSNGLGRWITGDWSATPLPVPYADLSDPQSLNLYSYVRNIPTSRADLNGHGDDPPAINPVGCGEMPCNLQPGILPLLWQATKDVADLILQGAQHNYDQRMSQPICSCSGSKLPDFSSQEERDSNNSYRSNEQGRDAQGKFVTKNPGESAPGAEWEKKALDSMGATKNTRPIPGSGSSTIPDGTIKNAAGEVVQYAEAKSGAALSNTAQLKEMAKAAMKATGKPLKLGVNPNAKIARTLKNNENIEIVQVK
jgi:RHS repeat-associated protein